MFTKLEKFNWPLQEGPPQCSIHIISLWGVPKRRSTFWANMEHLVSDVWVTVSVLCPRSQPRSALPHEARDTVRGGVRTEERRGEECLWAGMRVTEASVSCRTMRQDGVQNSMGYETASSLNRNLFCRCYRCFTVSLFYISTWTPCARTHHNL